MTDWVIAFTLPEVGQRIRLKYRSGSFANADEAGKKDVDCVFNGMEDECWNITITRYVITPHRLEEDVVYGNVNDFEECLHSDDVLKWKPL